MQKRIILGLLLAVLAYTRFIGLGWGLPYPMHPDERNMAVAIQSLRCTGLDSECLNPHFFAYGQLPLYLAYFGIRIIHFFADISTGITFIEATIALRIISAAASVLNILVLLKIVYFLVPKKRNTDLFFILSFLIFVFSPYFIQFSHFGTTESLLMLFYSLIVYMSLYIFHEAKITRKSLILLGVFSGLSIATKVSSLLFLAIPVLALFWKTKKHPFAAVFNITIYMCIAGMATVIFSPHNLISYPEFSSSLAYESSVGLGTYRAFYTRQFANTIPIIFPLEKIFPYALGALQMILAAAGLMFLSWKNKYLNLMRLSILLYFFPTAFLYAKWTRFMAPVFPLLGVLAILMFNELLESKLLIFKKIGVNKNSKLIIKNYLAIFFVLILILPGIAYLTIYLQPDIRFKASDWIYKNIPEGSKILSETANVIDIPIPVPGSSTKVRPFQYASFDFYNLDIDPNLQMQLKEYINSADYIIVPSRRVFANHSKSLYPQTAKYYEDLFSGKLGYKEVAVFANDYIGLSDEKAEETWTVFDHPVIRIFKKNPKDKIQNSNQIPNLKSYKTINYKLRTVNYKLLVADTPEKRTSGLMYVRSKEDIGGLDGMMFTFEDKGVRYFWNKNTVSDLDIYWLSDDTVVAQTTLPSIENSGQLTTITSPDGVNKVIEIIQ